MGPDVRIAIHRLDEQASLPSRGSSLAAGWDLRALRGASIPKGDVEMITTGLSMALPVGFEAQIRARSGLARRGLIIPNGPGTIDADYRGGNMNWFFAAEALVDLGILPHYVCYIARVSVDG